MPTSTILRGGHVLDLTDGTWRTADVRVDEATITAIGPGLAERDADELDVTGRYLMPGLIDGHVHVTAFSAELRDLEETAASYVTAHAARTMRAMLGRGFTSVRDMGGADHGLARAQAEGLLPGPRLFFCGHALSQTGGHGDMRLPGDDRPPAAGLGPGISTVADGVDGVRRAAREELRRGADHIKIMASGGVASPTDRIDSTQFSIAEIAAAVEEAAAANRYVGAHAYTARAINRALRAGVRSIEHGNLLDAESLTLLRTRDAFLVPTLVTYWALQREGRQHGLSATSWAKVEAVLDRGLASVRLAHEAGVRIVFGSDLLGGMHRYQNEEFRLRAQVQPLIDVIRSATTTAADLLGRSGTLGVLAPGAAADLLVLDADPLADVTVLADIGDHLRAVVQGGVVVHGALGPSPR
ncbi:amidohydrolase family protein [Nakamurella sp.]|uniref:metal-dependent hydrolase family protein n=1 Tax=Nakamurella sp. TaxID=1869182 RepID=UPI003B3B900B